MTQTKYILLDRDGVINQDSDHYIKTTDEWLPIAGSLEAIALLNRHGYQVFVITNQSGVGRGFFDMATLTAMHDKMQRLTLEKGGKISGIYFCPHTPDDNCNCRKPKPGLLQQFARENQVDLHTVYFIGDSLGDLKAAQAVGANGILVKTGKGKKTLEENHNLCIPIFEDLYDAAKHIISA